MPGQIRQGGEQVDGELRQRKEMGGEVAVMRFLLGFILGAFFTGNRVFRVAFLLIILFMVFCLCRM